MNVLTNPSAPVQTRQRLVINAAPARVWAVLTHIDGWAAWQPDIKRPHLRGPLQVGTPFSWKSSGVGIRSELHTVAPAAEFGWTGHSLGTFAIHNWTLKAVPGGTEVTVDETMEGLLARLLKGPLTRGLAQGTQQWLARLKAEAEK
ncbi:SRPBCC family protein [Hymenobacter armeniacus]|uniref:SRPBCC family protein n=1 Tax=Hymenobacter armeniacus TaxID=2771358 RepID=A0ABR8JP21_9BACT|nr:SRPBCC family protein [Hymenobacter armeniacus]MBD2721598.1 SRPBCC family protein [Hymenobacter armeniacus]